MSYGDIWSLRNLNILNSVHYYLTEAYPTTNIKWTFDNQIHNQRICSVISIGDILLYAIY